MRSILTSPERAHIIDATADGVQTIAPAGSEVLIYGSAPMLHYLTSTRPVLGNSWPEQLSTESLLRKLDLHLNGAPVIILKYNTIGNDFGTPSEAFMLGTEAETANIYHNAEKSGALLSYLHSKGYKCTKATSLYNVYDVASQSGRCPQSMCSRVLKQATVAASPVYFPLSSLSLQVWQ